MTNLEHNTQKKLLLINEVIHIILGNNIDLLKLEGPQKVSFVKQWPGNPLIYRLMELRWDNNLDFVVLEYMEKEWRGVYVSTSKWFKVRDLLRTKFLDTEKLKL